MLQKEFWPGICFDRESFFITDVNIKLIYSITGIISILYRIFKPYLRILGNQTIFCLTTKSPLVIPPIQIQTQKEAKKTRITKPTPHSGPAPSIRCSCTDPEMSPLTMISQVQEEPSLQLCVLRNHNPLIDTIICIAPLVVVYTFSLETETWAKANIEGTLFVTELLPSTLNPSQPRYSLVVLNQRNLENFTYSIKKAEHVELADEDFISLTEMHDQGRGDTVKTIWGLWVFSDPAAGEGETRMAEIMARVMGECAEKMEVWAAWAGDHDDVSSEEERGRKRVRQPRSATQWTLAEATCARSCLNPSHYGLHG